MNNMFQWDFLSVHFIQYGQGYMEFEYAQKRIVHLVVVQYGFVFVRQYGYADRGFLPLRKPAILPSNACVVLVERCLC